MFIISHNQIRLKDNNGIVLWEKTVHPHHDFFYDPTNKIAFVIVRRKKNLNGEIIWHDGIEGYDLKGTRVFSWYSDEHIESIEKTRNTDADLRKTFHMDSILSTTVQANTMIGVKINSIAVLNQHPLKYDNSAFKDGNILVSLNEYGVLVILEKKTGKIVWAHQVAETLVQKGVHSVRILPNGHFFYFQNLAKKKSYDKKSKYFPQIVEFDPKIRNKVWSYPQNLDNTFYSPSNCSAFMSKEGTTMISYTQNKSVIEINKEGEILWEWHPPLHQGDGIFHRHKIKRVRRVPKSHLISFLRKGKISF